MEEDNGILLQLESQQRNKTQQIKTGLFPM